MFYVEKTVQMALTDNNIVGKTKTAKDIMSSEDWKLAKEQADTAAADRIIDKLWSDKKTEKLKETIGDKSDVVFISQPTTSGENILPVRLAQRLSGSFKTDFIIGDNFTKALHSTQSKKIPKLQRPFNKRKYKIRDIANLRRAVRKKNLIIVEDVLTTGGSVSEFSKTLERAGFEVETVAALMGDRRLVVDRKTANRLDQALRKNKYNLPAKEISESLTRTEAGGVIMLINSARSQNAKKRLSEKLQRLLSRGNIKDLGGNKRGRHESERGTNKRDERLSPRVQTRDISTQPHNRTKVSAVEKLRVRRAKQKGISIER